MATGQPAKRSPSKPALQLVLELGEDLLCIAQNAYSAEASTSDVLLNQCDRITQAASQLLGGKSALWLSKDVLRSFFGKYPDPSPNHLTGLTLDQSTPLMQTCAESQQVCAAESSQQPATWRSFGPYPTGKVRAVAAPLLVHDRIGQTSSLLGVLQLERPAGHSLRHSEVEFFEAIAVQSALALQSNLHLGSERWRREQLNLVRDVSIQIAKLRDLDEIARQVTRLILQTFNYYYVAIFTLEADRDILNFRANAGPRPLHSEDDPTFASPDIPEVIYAPVELGQGIIGHAAQTGQEYLADNVQDEPRYRHLDLLPHTRSEIALPLITQNRLLGVMDIQSDQPNDFDEIDLLVLRLLAGSIANAIEDAQLYADLRRHAVQLQTVYEVSSAIASILDQEELLSQVVSLIQERFGYSYVHLFSVHPGRRKIFYEAGSGLRNQVEKKEDYTYQLDDSLGLIPWVARNGSTALVNDVRKEPRYRPSILPPDETLSELTLPLIFGGNVLGVLDIQSDQLNAFSQDDRFLFEALADHIAIALRNAYLYRSEVWRRGVADSLREVAGILSADVDLDQVLEAILTELEHTLPLDAAAIWLLDQSILEGTAEQPSDLHLAAMCGEGTSNLYLEIGSQPEEVLEYNLDDPSRQEIKQASTWLMEALQSDAPVIRSAGSPFEPLSTALGFPKDYSAIAAPLRSGEHLLGVLSLSHRTPGRYGSEAQAMAAAFASYASVAIENTRLYEDAHEQAWISTVLLRVANATQSVDNLPELLDTVIHITPMLTGVKACLLYILDEDGSFVPAAASGLTYEQQTEFERWRFAAGDVPALDRLVAERRPVILHSGEEDQRLSSILAAGLPSEKQVDIGFPVLVPLQARGEALGAFLVNYSAALPVLSLGKSFEAYFDERLAILQGIAHQTAVAMDNIRLLKAQKEEAYVSVALLQVAQAVVSSNDLDESLGSIVRITPILVGVKRTGIFLWDESQSLFRLSQSYGLLHPSETPTYKLREFPLLDAVLVENCVLACPLQTDQMNTNAPQAWTHLPVPDLQDVDRLLNEEEGLLIAFPLAVKGKILGVFIVEEPDPILGDTYSVGNPNRRLRPKRMEIITGISQQAALAIQNDLLQKETVERERLEREMQLARQIQTAFLPHNIPVLPGWDLQVYWRPAREVGGDFYDFFELPGDRLGMVIADVADKGMPAALFMTLVRTLVRATVEVLNSPADVVARVNDLLFPDAMSGMFVTLVYAVLDLNTGELKTTNAGHNPPLVLHQPCRFERVQRDGMALGVTEHTPFHSHSYQIEPGDLLVMYTDGVTKSFALDGKMFGEERLLETIEQAAHYEDDGDGLSAQAILQAIDGRVLEFSGDEAPSDDLTLVVLKRSPDVGGVRPAI